MKKTLLFIVPLIGLAMAAGAAAGAPVGRSVIRSAEKLLEARLRPLWPDTPSAIIGGVRGVYLDGYGAVFTAEMNTASENLTPIISALTPAAKDSLHRLKIQRMPQLKTALEQSLAEVGATLDTVPQDEQIVLQVVLDRYEWEAPGGYPAELLLQTTRRKIADAKIKGGSDAISVRVTDH
jgi:hypothetical protein